jgi:hypothetical protein
MYQDTDCIPLIRNAAKLLAMLASVQISYLVGCLLAAHLPARCIIETKQASGRAVLGRVVGDDALATDVIGVLARRRET